MKALKKHLKEKTHIIWDWNGTLLDDVELCVNTISHVLKKNGLPAITREAYLKKFCFPVKNYYQQIGFDFDKVDFSVVANEFIEKYRESVAECGLHSGAYELLQELKCEGKIQSILSAAKQTDLLEQLETLKVKDYFRHVFGISDHYAAGKVERGHQLIEALGTDLRNIVMIGDTDHDFEVARAMGVEMILLGDGHQCPDKLSLINTKLIRDRYVP